MGRDERSSRRVRRISTRNAPSKQPVSPGATHESSLLRSRKGGDVSMREAKFALAGAPPSLTSSRQEKQQELLTPEKESSRKSSHLSPSENEQQVHPSKASGKSNNNSFHPSTDDSSNQIETTIEAHLAIDEDEEFEKQARAEAEAKILSHVTKAEVTGVDDSSSSRFKYIICICIVVVAAVIGAIVGILLKESDESAEALSPTDAPTIFVDPSESSNLCTDALELPTATTSAVSRDGTTIGMDVDDVVDVCDPLRSTGVGVWYFLEGNGGILSIDTCTGASFDTQITIFRGKDCTSLTCVAANDQRDACGQDASQLFFQAEQGVRYYVMVHGTRDATGVFTLSMSPENDNSQCSDAIEFDDFQADDEGVQLFGTTRFSSLRKDMPECSGVQITSPGVWYTFRSQNAKFVQARVRDLAARVTVYQGGCDALQCVASDISGRAMWTAVPQTKYLIFVHGQGDNVVGDFSFAALPGGMLRPPPDAPDNVQCQTAERVYAPTWVTSSTERGQVATNGICGSQVISTAPGLWYVVSGTGSGMLASTCGTESQFDTQISVFAGDCSNLQCIDGADQTCGDQSSVAWHTELGVEYFVLVHGANSRVGTFNLTVDIVSSDSKDECEEAIPVAVNGPVVLGSTRFASPGFAGTCVGAANLSVPAVWYKMTSEREITITASTCDPFSDSFSHIQVFTGSCGELECVDIKREECGEQMTATWDAKAKQVYYIMVFEAIQNYGQRPGDFKLWVEEAPENYICSGADASEMSVGSTVVGSTRIVASEDDWGCTLASAGSSGRWYKVTGTTASRYSLSACSEATNFSPLLRVFAGSDCRNLACVDVNNGSKCGAGSAVVWEALPGQVYYVQVQGTSPSQIGNFALTLGVANNICDTSIPLEADGQVVMGSTIGATEDSRDLSCFYDGIAASGPSVWYSVVGTGSLLEATTCHSATNYDTQLSVFEGASCEVQSCILGNDNACGLQSTVSWFAVAGEKYSLLVHGYSSGNFGVSLREVSNDDCNGAYSLPMGTSSSVATTPTFGTSNQNSSPCALNAIGSPTSWYSIKGPGGEVTVDVCDSGGTISQVSVLSSGCESRNCIDTVADNGCSVSFNADHGEDYRLAVSGPNGFPSSRVSVIASNDVCEAAFGPLKVGESVRGSTLESTVDSAAQCGSFETGRGAGNWYRFPGNGERVTFFTCSDFTDFDTQISIYTGDSCGQLECYDFADDNCGLTSWRSILTLEGQEYYILVSGKGSSRGNYELLVQ